jgi:PPE-repeat protein
MAGDFDFGVLPPEVNSGLMYAGAGPQSLLAAAAAWADLARGLDSAAGICAGVLSRLTGSDWQSPAAAAMTAAATPYTSWLQATAGHAAQAAGQATRAVNAYENAFAATVPPAVVAANRAQLASLIATNVLGQNSAAIAVTEAQYAEMWAQDAAAMYGYAAQSAAAAALTPLTIPPPVTNDTGPARQAAATTHATTAAAGTTQADLSQLLSSLPSTLTALATGSTSAGGSTSSSLSALVNSLGLNIFSSANATSDTGLSGFLNNVVAGANNSAVSDFLNSNWMGSLLSNGAFTPEIFLADFHAFDFLVIYAVQDFVQNTLMTSGAADPGILGQMANMAAAHTLEPTALGPLTAQPVGKAILAGAHANIGRADLVGPLSVPPGWTATAPLAQTVNSPVTAQATAHMPSPLFSTGMPRLAPARMTRRTGNYEASSTSDRDLPTRALTGRTPVGG